MHSQHWPMFDHRVSAAFSLRQADWQLPGADPLRRLQRRSATTGTHQQTRRRAVAFSAGGGGASRCPCQCRLATRVPAPGNAPRTIRMVIKHLRQIKSNGFHLDCGSALPGGGSNQDFGNWGRRDRVCVPKYIAEFPGWPSSVMVATVPCRRRDQDRCLRGAVEEIQTRATIVKAYDGRQVVIPNSDLFTHAVIVNTALGSRRWQYDLDAPSVNISVANPFLQTPSSKQDRRRCRWPKVFSACR